MVQMATAMLSAPALISFGEEGVTQEQLFYF